MTTWATWQDLATGYPAAFLVGMFVGWIVSQRYAIVRRRENGEHTGRDYDRGP